MCGLAWLQGGKDGAEAKVALANDLTGRLFATWTPTAGACRFRLATGALGAKSIPLAPVVLLLLIHCTHVHKARRSVLA